MIRTKDHLFLFPYLLKSPVKSTDKVYNLARKKSTKLAAKRLCDERLVYLVDTFLSSVQIDQTGELSSYGALG